MNRPTLKYSPLNSMKPYPLFRPSTKKSSISSPNKKELIFRPSTRMWKSESVRSYKRLPTSFWRKSWLISRIGLRSSNKRSPATLPKLKRLTRPTLSHWPRQAHLPMIKSGSNCNPSKPKSMKKIAPISHTANFWKNPSRFINDSHHPYPYQSYQHYHINHSSKNNWPTPFR